MENKQRKINFIKAFESGYGLCPTIAGAFVLLSVIYVFMNVDIFRVFEESQNSDIYFIIFVVIVGLVGGAMLTWLIINAFKKSVGIADSIAMMIMFVGIGCVALKYQKDGFDIKNISIEYYIYLGLTVLAIVLLIIHTIRYKFEENKYGSYRDFEVNSNFRTYYKELFKKFPIVWMGLLALLCIAGIVLIDANEEVMTLANSSTGKIIVYILSGGALVSYLIGIVLRIRAKKISIIDLGIFMVDIAGIVALGVSLYSFFTNSQPLLKLIVSGAAVIFGAIVTLILAVSTYIPVPMEEKIANEAMLDNEEKEVGIISVPKYDNEDLQEENAENQEEKTNIEQKENDSIDEEDEEMAEQIKAIIDQLSEQNKVNTTMNQRLDNIDRNLQLIADILKGLATDTIASGVHTIEVPISDALDTEAPQSQEIPETIEEVSADQAEESVTAQEDYFEQVAEEQKIDDNNANIATEYAEGEDEDNWIANADNEVRIKPKMSFEMKLRIASEDTKKQYSDIKNALMSYGIHDRISRHRENFNQGRINICRIVINGKTLKVYLAVDPTSIDERYFHQEDVGHRKGLVDLPTMINVRSKVAARKVKELIDLIMESLVIKKKKYESVDYAAQYTLDGFTTVECKGFDYLVKKDVKLSDAVSYPDVFASQLLEMVEDDAYQEKFIKTTLTIDDIVKNFTEGEIVDIEAIRKKKLGPNNTNFLFVKESGELNKKYKVYANEYTPNAVKMICLAGGEAFLVVQPEKTIEEV